MIMNQSALNFTSESLKKLFSGRREVVAVYLYGSVARGLSGKLSDVDFAVLLREPLQKSEIAIRLDLLTSVNKFVTKKEVDLQVLTTDSDLEFVNQVFIYGLPILINDQNYLSAFRRQMLLKAIDFRPVNNMATAAMLNRMNRGVYAG